MADTGRNTRDESTLYIRSRHDEAATGVVMADQSLPDATLLPERLVARSQWVCWRVHTREGKETKVPINPATRQFASTTDASTWSSFADAVDTARAHGLAGVGFVFSDDDPFVGIDLDNCRVPETETVLPWAAAIVTQLDSYTEVSPSGTGLHVIVEGSLPSGGNRRGDLECYETARFFTVTGEHVASTPTEIHSRLRELAQVHAEYIADSGTEGASARTVSMSEASVDSGGAAVTAVDGQPTRTPVLTDTELVRRARAATNGDRIGRLLDGDTSGYASQSEAEMALCCHLAFWSGGDAGQIDRLIRDSGLCRAKWDEVHYADGATYGERTIERAVALVDETYEPLHTAPNDTVTPTEAAVATKDSSDSERETRLWALHERVEELEARERRYLETIERLHARLVRIETTNEALDGESVDAVEQPAASQGFFSRLRQRLRDGRG